MRPEEEFSLAAYPREMFPGTLGDSLRSACQLGYRQGVRDGLTPDLVREVSAILWEFHRDGWPVGAETDEERYASVVEEYRRRQQGCDGGDRGSRTGAHRPRISNR